MIPSPTLKPSNHTSHYIYFFFGTVDRQWNRNEWMFVKVGIATNVYRRLKSYQTHCPVPFHTGLRALLPNVDYARRLEHKILNDELLCGYRAQGEWFVVFAGPEEHVIFIKNLLARFYIERLKDKSIWNTRLEWVILPDQNKASEIPEADSDYFCGPETGSKNLYEDGGDGTELMRRVNAQNQAEALGRLIYPELATES